MGKWFVGFGALLIVATFPVGVAVGQTVEGGDVYGQSDVAAGTAVRGAEGSCDGVRPVSVDLHPVTGSSPGGHEVQAPPIAYVGEITKFFAVTLSVILAVFAFFISAVQIGFSFHLSKREEQAGQLLRSKLEVDMEKAKQENRSWTEEVVTRGLEKHVRKFDKIVGEEVGRAIGDFLEIVRRIDLVQKSLIEAGQSVRPEDLADVEWLFRQHLQEASIFLQLAGTDPKGIFDALGFIEGQLKPIPKDKRPRAVLQLLKSLNGSGRLIGNNYLLAVRICRNLFGDELQDDPAQEHNDEE